MYLPVPGLEPTSSVFLFEYVAHSGTVADMMLLAKAVKHPQ